MSTGHIPQEKYIPKSKAAKWVDCRLPVGDVAVHFQNFPTPKNLNWLWVFGGILTICLMIQIATGVPLAMHYTPHVDFAFDSIQHITRNVNGGDWLKNVHAVGASFFFLAVYIHIFRGLFYGSYKNPRELLWIIGVLIYVLMMATAFMGYVLPWGQMSFWGATVITGLFSALPLFGESLLTWLQGGFAIDNATLNRFFALHYLLPFVIAGLVALHIWALHHVGNNNPTGVPVRSSSVEDAKRDTVPFSPYYTVKDLFAIIVFLIIFAIFVFYMPDYLGHPSNYTEADPLSTPDHIVPEWYFLPFYAILRSIPDKLGGVLMMFAAIGVLAVVPWLDTSRVRSGTYRPLFAQFFGLFLIACLGLGFVGSWGPDEVLFGDIDRTRYVTEAEAEAVIEAIRREDPEAVVSASQKIDFAENEAYWEVEEIHWAFRAIHLGQFLTAYYFAFFLVILPLLGLLERPRRLPETIEADFIARKAQKGAPADAASQPAE